MSLNSLSKAVLNKFSSSTNFLPKKSSFLSDTFILAKISDLSAPKLSLMSFTLSDSAIRSCARLFLSTVGNGFNDRS